MIILVETHENKGLHDPRYDQIQKMDHLESSIQKSHEIQRDHLLHNTRVA